jgi:hypothetical protein
VTRLAGLLLGLVLLPGLASAQADFPELYSKGPFTATFGDSGAFYVQAPQRAYTYDELAALKPSILAHCEAVRQENPVAWREAHNGAFDARSRRFNDLCAQRLRAHGIYAGMNGKRGDPRAKSDDVLNFGLVAGQGGALDRSGRFAEIAIIDFIIRAGEPDASIGWIDQSKAAPGYFLDPEGLPADVAPVAPGGLPQPPKDVTQGPSVPVSAPKTPDYTGQIADVLSQLAAIRSDIAVLRAEAGGIRGEAANAHESLYRLIAETVIAEHADDIKRRIDALAQQIANAPRPQIRLPW